jgi:coiled-coil and C2 domain-containing protein 2A
MTPWGFPINKTFTSLEDLWQVVKATRIHDIDDRTAQFSLSVYVHQYPCNILSVWMYICAYTGTGLLG